MDNLESQLSVLSTKVDGLYQLIDQLSGRVSDIVSECKLEPDQPNRAEMEMAMAYRHNRVFNGLDSTMEHKDVLVDSHSLDPSLKNPDRQLTPEIQIQRLTAQLTAAYSRIAALEELLISKRIH